MDILSPWEESKCDQQIYTLSSIHYHRNVWLVEKKKKAEELTASVKSQHSHRERSLF